MTGLVAVASKPPAAVKQVAWVAHASNQHPTRPRRDPGGVMPDPTAAPARISADNPASVLAVPVEIRGMLDSCSGCCGNGHFDLYAPEQTSTHPRGAMQVG